MGVSINDDLGDPDQRIKNLGAQAMNDAAQAGDYERAHALYARFLPLIVFEQQPGVAVRKELYRLRGLIESAHVRHPAAPSVSPALAKALKEQLARSLPGIDVSKPLPASVFEGV